jgi:hypothetical protein
MRPFKVIVEGHIKGTLFLIINERRYTYDLDDAKILEFKKLLRFNRGHALAYLKRETNYENHIYQRSEIV